MFNNEEEEIAYLFNEAIVFLKRIHYATNSNKYIKIAENLAKDYWLMYNKEIIKK